MARRSRAVSPTTLVCEECGDYFPIVRKTGRQREKGHIKHLYCVRCRKETAHFEIGGGY